MPMPGKILNKSILDFRILACVPTWYFFLALRVLLDYEAINSFVDYFVYQILFEKRDVPLSNEFLGKEILHSLI